MSRIRKALGAGLLAALTLVGTKVQQTGVPADGQGWVTLLAAAVAAGIVTGAATYALRNEGTVNGSDPR